MSQNDESESGGRRVEHVGDRYVRFYAVVAEVHDDSDSIELDEPPLWRKRFER